MSRHGRPGGNIIISIALNVQKLAHVRLESASASASASASQSPSISPRNERQPLLDEEAVLDHDERDQALFKGDHTYLQNKTWWLGLSLMALGEFGNFVSYGFAPASLVAPLGCVAIIANCLLSPLMLKERFQWKDMWGVLLAMAGAALVVASTSTTLQQEPLDPDTLIHLLKQVPCIIYLCVSTSIIIGLALLSRTQLGDRHIMIDIGVTALAGAYTVLATKAVSTFLSIMFLKALTLPITWGVLVVLATSAVVQIVYLNKALQRYDSRQVVPTNFVVFTISAIVASSVVFGDFRDAQADALFYFIAGCIAVFGGVRLLT